MDDNVKKVLSLLETQCSKREYCSSDIRRKAMEKLEWNQSAADEVLASLVADGYVDDFRYASAFAREKAALTGWGPVKIRFALSSKQIPRDVIDRAMEEVDDEKAAARLQRLLESKFKSLQGDPEIKLKLLKYALSRGYDYDSVRQSVDDLTG